MAIRLTNLNNKYLHIKEYYRSKDGLVANFPVEYYEDNTKAVKTPAGKYIDNTDVENPIEYNLPNAFTFDISAEVTAGTDKIEKIAYDKIGAALLAAGLGPESDETGSWVAYS